MYRITACLLLLLFIGCRKNDCLTGTPVCIQNKITEIKAKPKGAGPDEVNEYIYNGKRVFHFAPYCCDRYGELLDENCNYICAPNGGISGGGDGKCKDFFTTATNKKLIWKDDR